MDRDNISLESKTHVFVSALVELVGFHMAVQAYLRCADVPGAGGGVALRHLVDAARAPREAGVSLETCKLEENKESISCGHCSDWAHWSQLVFLLLKSPW